MTSARSRADATLAWLLEGDPAIRWQAMRDLAGASASVVAREQAKVAREGWGARLLARQDADGRWAASMYSPKWISTTYTMLLLRDLGLPAGEPHAEKACALLLDQGMHEEGGISFGWPRSETCVTGIVLSVLSHFAYDDGRLQTLADYLLREQMPDGGWNCRRARGATHASVHTTISALEALRLYGRLRGALRPGRAGRVEEAQARGREFLLAHRLFRSHRTGNVINSQFLRFSFPPRWHYDVLRALDYFQATAARRDARLTEAIDVVRRKQQPNGRWRLEGEHRGRTFFALERAGAPSRWNTLRARRVLAWWDAGQAPSPARRGAR